MPRIVLPLLVAWAHVAAVAAVGERLLRKPNLRGGVNANAVSLPSAQRHLETVGAQQLYR